MTMPRSALILGLAGLLPFYAYLVPAMRESVPMEVFHGYGVAILAFMAGVQWGAGVSRDVRNGWMVYGLSVIPALWAVLAFHVAASMVPWILLAGFTAVLLVDLLHHRHGLYAGWYLRLRLLLSSLVGAALLGWAWVLA